MFSATGLHFLLQVKRDDGEQDSLPEILNHFKTDLEYIQDSYDSGFQEVNTTSECGPNK